MVEQACRIGAPTTAPTINLHAQEWQHQPAFIVGNRAGLEALRDLIDRALASDVSVNALAFPSDGEGFHLHIFCTDDLVDAPLGYTDEIARHDGDWPGWMRRAS